jgi:hypothetical protein
VGRKVSFTKKEKKTIVQVHVCKSKIFLSWTLIALKANFFPKGFKHRIYIFDKNGHNFICFVNKKNIFLIPPRF